MGFGGYHCYPRRFGGNRHNGKPTTEIIHKALNAARGPAFNTEDGTTIVWVENLAYARALAYDGWEVNDRMALQWDPLRTTDMLSRWETIFRIRPAPDVSDYDRRKELASRWARFGEVTNHARMYTLLSEALGEYFVDLEYITGAAVTIHTDSPAYPWGTPITGVPWYSTAAIFLVRMQKPAAAPEGDFYEMAGKVSEILDPIVSAFVKFNWYRGGPSSYAVTGGPSAAGFFLDETNLGNEVFGA